MCCSFWEKCINSQKNGLGCSTPLSDPILGLYVGTFNAQKQKLKTTTLDQAEDKQLQKLDL